MAVRYWLCTLLCFGLMASGPACSAVAQGYVHEVRGDVQLAAATGKPVKVEKNQALTDGSTITTGPDSNAIIRFVDGTVIALNQNTSFTVQKYDFNEKTPSTMTAFFSMLRGGLRVVSGTISQKNREGFKIATPSATIGIRGTEFMVQRINPTYLSVINGSASMTNAAGTAVFGAGQTGFVASVTSFPISVTAVPPGTFGNLPGLGLPPAVPGTLPPVGATGAVGAASGGLSGAVIGGAAAAAAVAASAGSSGSNQPVSGTTGTK